MSAILGKATAPFCSPITATANTVRNPSAVGYQNKPVVGGVYNMNVGTFLTIGKAKADMTFGDIKASMDFLFGQDTIMTLTPNGGRTGDIMTYLTEEEAATFEIPGLHGGWYDYDYVNYEWSGDCPIPEEKCFNNVKLPFGTMYVVQGTEGATIDYAGEVLNAAHQFTIVGGQYNMIGNATPVDIKMGDVVADINFLFGQDTIMTLTPNGGRTGDIMTYLTAEEAATFEIPGLHAGWYDYNYVNYEWTGDCPIPEDKCFNTMNVPAGYGFIAQGTEGSIVEIPSPLAD